MQEHHHLFYFLKNRELNELYSTIAIRSFALSMTGIFIPIFLYQLGYPFQSIFSFYLFAAVVHAFFTIPFAKLSSKIGLKHSMLISIFFMIIFFVLLGSLESIGWPLFLLSLFFGMNTSLFWLSYHVDFARVSDKKNRGKEVGMSQVLVLVFGVLGPLIGALILNFFGFTVLFILVFFLLLSSTVPLFLSREVHESADFSLKGFFRNQKPKNVLAYIGHGIENKIGAVVWPLFIFIFIFGEQYLSLGAVSSIAVFFALASTFVVGKFSGKKRRKVLKIGSISNAIVWVGKSFIVTPSQVFIVDSFYGASQAAMHVSFDALNYDKGKKGRFMKTIVQREIYHHVGVIILFLTMIFLVDSFVDVFRFGGSISSLMRFFF